MSFMIQGVLACCSRFCLPEVHLVEALQGGRGIVVLDFFHKTAGLLTNVFLFPLFAVTGPGIK